MPGESRVFTTHVDPVSPPWIHPAGREWWRRRVLPPGPQRLFHTSFIAIVGVPTSGTIDVPAARSKTRGHGPAVAGPSARPLPVAPVAAPWAGLGCPDPDGLRDFTAPAGREPARLSAGQAGQGAGVGRCPDRVMHHGPANKTALAGTWRRGGDGRPPPLVAPVAANGRRHRRTPASAGRRTPVPAILQPPAAQAVASGRSRNADEEYPHLDHLPYCGSLGRDCGVPGACRPA